MSQNKRSTQRVSPSEASSDTPEKQGLKRAKMKPPTKGSGTRRAVYPFVDDRGLVVFGNRTLGIYPIRHRQVYIF